MSYVNLPWVQRVWQAQREPLPPLQALAHLPPPAFDPDDSPELDDEALMRIAVLLDVLCTQTRRMQHDSTILLRLTRLFTSVAHLEIDEALHGAQLQSLVQFAATPAGDVRAQLNERLAAHASGAGSPHSIPNDVTRATQRLEHAATILIDEACLLLAARGVMQLKQA